jgi:uncharacterized protein YbjT (DUF2867 family)
MSTGTSARITLPFTISSGDGIDAQLGDLTRMSIDDLSTAMKGSDIVVFSAGAGGKDGDDATTAIDGEGPGRIAEAAAQAGINRFYLVSVFPEAWRERHMDAGFEHYMIEKKRAEVDLVKRDLDWVILRPSALSDNHGTGHVALGFAEIHQDITRDDVAGTMVALIEQPAIKRVILEVTGGDVPIQEAVSAFVGT